MQTTQEKYISIPETQYKILKKAYELGKKQQEYMRMYEVEQNIKNKNYTQVSADDFIESI
ncbi:hypothetical protein CSB09_01745 [Candidatus Gracilibacteria bacterium]|nr:MAG: hypothetical protein CSB09_01745 [Candidatus Gracilibacteria bacterium]